MYHAPIKDITHILSAVLPYGKLSETEKYAEADFDTVMAVLEEAGKLAEEVIAPTNQAGDHTPAVVENGVVRSSPGFKEAFKALADAGWVGMNADPEHGGLGLPITVMSAVGEMSAASNMALTLCPLLSQGQIEALEKHASDDIKEMYLPRLNSGEWTGTMNLTEPHAGTDVGALRSKAVPNGDGTYKVSGQKIFITWGEHDMTENICHLVLARLPNGVAGSKGISLFMVPKFIPNEDGTLGERNALRVVSLEHKIGIHGSPTCVMEFDEATGWLVGEPHNGMAAMFTMMNNARLGVGIQGLGQAEAAYQRALAYALDRKQGKTPVGDGNGAIIDHADVRRMLYGMKSQIHVARAICLECALSLDMAAAGAGDDWDARAAFLTPIAKAFTTDLGVEVASTAVQVHGGMGFVEETGIAQYYRDVRITPIYEGTNGIQAMDMVGRKFKDQGEMARILIDEIGAVAKGQDASLRSAIADAADALSEATDWMAAARINDRFASSVPYLRAFALALGGRYLALSAAADPKRKPLLEFYAKTYLPQVRGNLAAMTLPADVLYAMDHDDLAL